MSPSLSVVADNDLKTQKPETVAQRVLDLRAYSIKKLKEIGVWGWAFWNWSHIPDSSPDFNLITVTLNGDMATTKYFDILKHAVAST